MGVGGGHDLHKVAGLQLGGQRHDAAVHLRADAAVAHGGVDAVSKVQWGRAAGQRDHVALGREHEHLVREQVDLGQLAELAGVAHVALPVQNAPQPAQLLIQLVFVGAALLVPPVGGDAVLRGAVHLEGADLHLEGLALVDHGGVQRLVHVRLGHGDVVLEAARNLGPHGVHHAQHEVAVLLGVDQNAQRDQIVDLVEGLVLGLHLLVDGVEVLGPAGDLGLDAGLAQPHAQLLGHVGDQPLALLALHAHQPHQLLVALGIDVAQRQVLQLPLDGVHAHAVGQRRVDVQRLPGDGNLALRALVLQRAHVVQAVGQLDEHHADVLGHGQEHLAQRLRLGLLAGSEVQLAQLGHAVHQQLHLLAELLANGLLGHAVHVLHAVVQEARGDGGGVQHQVGEDHRHRTGMAEVRLARLALLIFVRLLRIVVGAAHKIHVVLRMVLANPADQIFQTHVALFCITGHGRTLLRSFCVGFQSRATARWIGDRSFSWAAGACRRGAPAAPPAACPSAPAEMRGRR